MTTPLPKDAEIGSKNLHFGEEAIDSRGYFLQWAYKGSVEEETGAGNAEGCKGAEQ